MGICPYFCTLGKAGARHSTRRTVWARSIADRLFGDSYVFSTPAAGRHQVPMAAVSAVMGGNIRVGLDGRLYIGRGKLASLMQNIRENLERVSLEIAAPDEARAMLALKGGEDLAFERPA